MVQRSFRTQLLVGSLLPAFICLIIAGDAGYTLARRSLEAQLGETLASDAAALASQIDRVRLTSVQPGDDARGTRSYRSLYRQVSRVRDAVGARRVFVVDAEGKVVADAGRELPVGTRMPELDRDRREVERAKAGAPSSSEVLFAGTDGRLYKTGYAAIVDDGQLLGVVGVEGSARFFAPLAQLARDYGALALLTLVLLALVSAGLARRLTRPLRQLVEAALRMGRGDLATPIPSTASREIAMLARELDLMRQALQARNEQLNLMLGGIAHEVKNPLGAIELFAGLLREELPEGPARAHVDHIRGELEYLKRIVEEFLTFARRDTPVRLPLLLPWLLRSVVSLVSADANLKQVRLEPAVENVSLEGDESLLAAALVNLVRNAVQASPPGATVALRGRASGDRCRIEVQDQGPGIPAASRDRVFEPFYSTREKGTGLGLPLARKIIQAHGGELRFESQPGRTIFRVDLPLRAPSGEAGATT